MKKNPKNATFDYHVILDVSKWPRNERTPRKIKQLHDEIQKVFCQTLADEFGFGRIFVRDCETGQFKGTVVENGELVGRLMDRKTRYLKIKECYDCPHLNCWPSFKECYDCPHVKSRPSHRYLCTQTHKAIGKPHHIPRWCPLPNFGKLTGRE